jgi:hypothetical protein
MNAEPVGLVDAFEVPEGEAEAFLQGWERTREPQYAEGVRLHEASPEPLARGGLSLRQRRALGIGAGLPRRHLPARVQEHVRPLPLSRLGVYEVVREGER